MQRRRRLGFRLVAAETAPGRAHARRSPRSRCRARARVRRTAGSARCARQSRATVLRFRRASTRLRECREKPAACFSQSPASAPMSHKTDEVTDVGATLEVGAENCRRHIGMTPFVHRELHEPMRFRGARQRAEFFEVKFEAEFATRLGQALFGERHADARRQALGEVIVESCGVLPAAAGPTCGTGASAGAFPRHPKDFRARA